MSSSDNLAPKAMPLLIEGPSGVTEYVVGMIGVNGKPVISLLGARVVSGDGSSLDREKLHEAIALHQWASTHMKIFEKGRVVPSAE